MQEIQGNMDDVLSRNDLRGDEKAKRYFQLQNRNLAFKEQLNTRTRPEEIISTVPDFNKDTTDSSTATTAFFTPLNPFNVTPELTQADISQKPDKESHPPTPPLRADVCKYREFAVKTEISKFFIVSQKKPFGETFSKITIKVSKEFSFSRKPGKSEMLPHPI